MCRTWVVWVSAPTDLIAVVVIGTWYILGVGMDRMSPHLSCTAAYLVEGQKCLVIEGKFCLGTKNYPSASRAWKDDSVLYTLMPWGKGFLDEWQRYRMARGHVGPKAYAHRALPSASPV
ncbi:hypothetical protein CONLIGDRAFT_276599 [Coniochaeta ligniaria NRRL 30616]|uniref:Uncharacterized protein n=1 Tax=Coniochaeta ligniaria NRRL 30616 TaxID=1408157 RepID=A0A1J7IZV4_9PEZI|nr:hypothetical protein CONLIGDRAFT_276599 [Coniochaeta ligniaria NRRL 30616]